MSVSNLKRLFGSCTLARVTRREFFPSIVVMRMNGSDPSSFGGVITDGNDIFVILVVFM